MKVIRKTAIAIAISSIFVAHANAEGLNYSFVDVVYVSNSAPGIGDGTGFGIDASFEVSSNVFLYIGSQSVDFSSVGELYGELKAGVGIHQPINEKTDWYGKIDYRGFSAISATASGFSISGGARGALGNNVELDGYLGVADYTGRSGYIFGLNGVYKFSENFGISAGYMNDNSYEWSGFRVGARMYF